MVRSKQVARKSTSNLFLKAQEKRLRIKIDSKASQIKNSQMTKNERYRLGIIALQEIQKYQMSTHVLIPKLSFQRLVRETLLNINRNNLKLQCASLEVLQVSLHIHVGSSSSIKPLRPSCPTQLHPPFPF